MHHNPGYRKVDFDHYLDYNELDGAEIILSKGMDEVLKIDPKMK